MNAERTRLSILLPVHNEGIKMPHVRRSFRSVRELKARRPLAVHVRLEHLRPSVGQAVQ